MDLQLFGQKLRQLRQRAGLTQKELAGQLFISLDLLSKWEKAREYRGRHWQPDQESVVRLVRVFARYLNPIEAQTWVNWAGRELSLAQLAQICGAIPHQIPPLLPLYIHRCRLEQALLEAVRLASHHTLVLQGMGGAGKSTLAAWLAHTLAQNFPDGIVWVDQQGRPDLSQAQAWIAHSFGAALKPASLAEQAGALRSLLHGKQCLLILDDVWADPDLKHLLVCSPPGRLLITTRDTKVADQLHAPFIPVSHLSQAEGLALLEAWAGQPVRGAELISLLAGHALALSLSGAQLRAGLPLADLLATLQARQIDLSVLDLNEAQDRAENLVRCFDLSYERLPPGQQQQFARLSCFGGPFYQDTAAVVWGIEPGPARDALRQFTRLALLQEENTGVYRLHPLLRAYAGHKLSAWPAELHRTWQRYAAWRLRYTLYHPAVLDDVTDPAPALDQAWPDVVTAVAWAVKHDPPLAARAAVLAHTERPALLAELGPELITAVAAYLAGRSRRSEQAILAEILGELCLLQGSSADSLAWFHQAGAHWRAMGNWLASARTWLRAAGVHLLEQNRPAAAVAAREAQADLARNLPIALANLEEARWLFYWFEMIYSPLARWPDLPEEEVANLAGLARQTNSPILEARGLHIYRLWCTADPPRSEAVRERGRQLALAAYKLWRACGRLDRADDEISWTRYQLSRRYSRRTAARFARRRSQTTPNVNQAQIRLIKEEGMRWWLAAAEPERIAWLSQMLPRYLQAVQAPGPPLSPISWEYRWVEEILNIGVMGNQGRWLAPLRPLPAGHILNGPEWYVLSGQKTLPLAGQPAVQLVNSYLEALTGQLQL